MANMPKFEDQQQVLGREVHRHWRMFETQREGSLNSVASSLGLDLS